MPSTQPFNTASAEALADVCDAAGIDALPRNGGEASEEGQEQTEGSSELAVVEPRWPAGDGALGGGRGKWVAATAEEVAVERLEVLRRQQVAEDAAVLLEYEREVVQVSTGRRRAATHSERKRGGVHQEGKVRKGRSRRPFRVLTDGGGDGQRRCGVVHLECGQFVDEWPLTSPFLPYSLFLPVPSLLM